MHRQIKRGFIALCLPFLFSCSRPLSPQDGCNFVLNGEKQRVSWKGQLPVKLELHTSVPPEHWGAISRAVDEYNTKIGHGREIFKIVARGTSGEPGARQDGISTIYWMNVWDPARPDEQARTTIHWIGTQIFEADVLINAKNFLYYSGTETSFSDLDLDSLLVHELGHVLGLAHNVTVGSVMNISLNEGQDRRSIGGVDERSLSCEY